MIELGEQRQSRKRSMSPSREADDASADIALGVHQQHRQQSSASSSTGAATTTTTINGALSRKDMPPSSASPMFGSSNDAVRLVSDDEPAPVTAAVGGGDLPTAAIGSNGLTLTELSASAGSVSNGFELKACPSVGTDLLGGEARFISPEPSEGGLINKKLPKELLLKIFSFLDIVSLCRCAQVSKEWNVLAMDGSNWQDIDLFRFQRDITCEVVSYIARRCGGFLRRISLHGCQGVLDGALYVFAQYCHNIEQVILSNCHKLTDDSLVALAMACRNVHVLHIDSCVQLTDRSLRSFNRLRYVDISWCRKITGQGIGMIAGDNLLRFTARGCTGLDNEAISRLVSRSPRLQVLNLQCCAFLSDSAIIAVGQHCPDLRQLCVSGCGQLTDAAPQALAVGCPRLHTLEMANCVRCGDQGLAPLLRACHDLRRLDLEECSLITDQTLNHVAAFCPLAEQLTLSHCDQITDQGIQRLAQAPLRRLVCIEIDNCPFISDVSLELLADHFPVLRRVELYDCQLITQEAISRFQQRRPGVRLHTYFAPATPNQQTDPPGGAGRQRYCRCCVIV